MTIYLVKQNGLSAGTGALSPSSLPAPSRHPTQTFRGQREFPAVHSLYPQPRHISPNPHFRQGDIFTVLEGVRTQLNRFDTKGHIFRFPVLLLDNRWPWASPLPLRVFMNSFYFTGLLDYLCLTCSACVCVRVQICFKYFKMHWPHSIQPQSFPCCSKHTQVPFSGTAMHYTDHTKRKFN